MGDYAGFSDGYGGWGTSARDRMAAAASGWQVIAPPLLEPVTLAEAKLHVRQDQPDDDAELPRLITDARELAEQRTGRALVTQTRRLTLEVLPRAWGGVGAYPGWREASRVRLPGPPLIDVLSIQYDDAGDGSTQTLDPSLYRVNADREPGVIEPAFGRFWPVTRIVTGAVRITYRCGWPVTTAAGAITAGTRTVTPASMAGLLVGTVLTVTAAGDDPAALTDLETVQVLSTTPTTFAATFAKNHAAGAVLNGVPRTLQQAILLTVGHGYRFRGDDDETGKTAADDLPAAAKSRLEQWWVGDQYP